MSFYKLKQMMQQEALKALNSKTSTMIGQITGYDPTNIVATVMLYPEDEATGTPALQTGWLPVFMPWTGPGWGIFSPPNIGDLVEVHFQEGSLQNGYIGLRAINSGSNNPVVQSGEFWIVHAMGSFFKLTNDGKVSISSTVEIDVTAPVVNINSPNASLGNLADQLLPLMNSAAQSVYNSHTHTVSGGSTSTPIEQIPDSALTTSIKGN